MIKSNVLNKKIKLVIILTISLIVMCFSLDNVHADIRSDLASRPLLQDTVLDSKYRIITKDSFTGTVKLWNSTSKSGGSMADNPYEDNTSSPDGTYGFTVGGRYSYGTEEVGLLSNDDNVYTTPTITYTFNDYYVEYPNALIDTLTNKEYTVRMYIKNVTVSIIEENITKNKKISPKEKPTTENWKINFGLLGTNSKATGKTYGMGVYFNSLEGNVSKYFKKVNINLEYKIYNSNGTEVTSALPGIAGITDIDVRQSFSFNNLNNNITSGDPSSRIYLTSYETLDHVTSMSYSNNTFKVDDTAPDSVQDPVGYYYFTLDDARTTNITLGMNETIGARGGLVFFSDSNNDYIKQKYNLWTSSTNGTISSSKENVEEGTNETVTYSSSNTFKNVVIDGTTVTKTMIDNASGAYIFTSNGDSVSVTTSSTTISSISSNHTVSVNYDIPKYSITYNTNGGNLPGGYPQEYTFGVGTSLPTPVKEGYTFIGWYSDSNLTNKVESITSGDSGDKTLYAKWEANSYPYTIKYCYENIDNENCSVDNSKTVNGNQDYATELSVSETDINNNKKTGFVYDSVKSNPSIVIGTDDNEIKIVYKREVKQVTFKDDNGDTIGSESVKYGAKITKPSNPSKPGYSFNKWLDGNNSEYNFNDSVTDDVELHASYNIINYTIDYNLNSKDKNHNDNPTTANVEGNVELKPASRLGYTFDGWVNKDGIPIDSLNSETILNTLENGKISISPMFRANSDTPYNIVYKVEKVDGGYDEIIPQQPQGTTDSVVKASDVATTMPGFTLTNPNESITVTAGTTSTLTLIYDRNTTTVNYNTNGGSNIPSENRKYGSTITGKTAEQITPTKQGYDFGGWTLNGNPCSPTTDTIPDASTITLDAVWIEGVASYKVKIYKESLEGTYNDVTESDPIESITNTRIVLDENTLASYEGFELDTTNPNSVLEENVAPDGSLVLKAYFKRKNQTITFKYDNSETNDVVEQIKYGGSIEEKEIPPKQGYTPDGWVDEKGYIFNFEDNVTNDVVLRPHYNPNNDTPYTVIVYKMKDKNNYEKEIITLTGTTDTEVEADVINIKGFKVNEKKSTLKGKVAPDGSLVLEVFYDIYNPALVRTGDIIKYIVLIIVIVISFNIFVVNRKRKIKYSR